MKITVCAKYFDTKETVEFELDAKFIELLNEKNKKSLWIATDQHNYNIPFKEIKWFTIE